MGEACVARRFGLQLQPPILFLEYADGQQRTRVRAVKLKIEWAGLDLDRLTRKVIRSFPRKLDPSSIKYEQVRKLVSRLAEAGRRPSLQAGSTPELLPDVPLTTQLAQIMRRSEEEGDGMVGRLSPTSSPGSSQATPAKAGRADKDGLLQNLEAMLASNRDQGPASHTGTSYGKGTPPSSSPQPGGPAGGGKHTGGHSSRFSQQQQEQQEATDRLVLDLEITEDTDLNRASEVELKMAKQQMEQEFLRHQLKPGDPRYAYDKQMEFGPPTAANEWDSD